MPSGHQGTCSSTIAASGDDLRRCSTETGVGSNLRRVGVHWHLIKDDRFRDNPPNPNFCSSMSPHEALLPLYTTDRPEMEEVLAEMQSVVDEFGDRLLIVEIYLPIERLVKYYGRAP
jgi:hypothetical protein